jgi:hypothetical protein
LNLGSFLSSLLSVSLPICSRVRAAATSVAVGILLLKVTKTSEMGRRETPVLLQKSLMIIKKKRKKKKEKEKEKKKKKRKEKIGTILYQ